MAITDTQQSAQFAASAAVSAAEAKQYALSIEKPIIDIAESVSEAKDAAVVAGLARDEAKDIASGLSASIDFELAAKEAEFESQMQGQRTAFEVSQQDKESDFLSSQSQREADFVESQTDRENRFQTFLDSSGYVFLGDYENGPFQFSARNQYIRYNNQYYRLNAATDVGFTTTGTDATSFVNDVTHFVLMDGDTLRQELSSSEGAGDIGINITNSYPPYTVGRKLSLLLSPWDFGAIADGVLRPLSQFYSTLSAAQAVYPFVTSLTQSIDYAATQKCVNEMVTRGAAGMTMGGRGRFCVSDTVQVNKTGSVNEANKYIDFSGTEICSFGGAVIFNDTTFSGWALQNGVSLSASKLVFAGTTAAQARATITVTGLTVGKSYAVSLVTEEYTSSGYLRIRLDGAAISNSNEFGPGVRYAEFTATATSHEIELQDDTYNTTPTACTVKEVDVRELVYPIRFYQTGSAITHGSMIVNNLRVVNKNSAAFGGIRCEDLNHARFTGVTGIDGFYGPAVHMLNMTIWSENNTIEYLKSANNREAIRFNRVFKNGTTTGLNSFARTQIDRIIISGNRYAVVCGVACSVYDSVIGPISGNLTSNFRAIFSLHGDQTGTLAKSVRVENNAAPGSAGIFEYGRNDLRRLFLADVGYYTGVKFLADGSLGAGTTSNENEMSNRDFRPSVPIFNTVVFLEKSGALGTGLTYSAGTYMWSELLLNCSPGTAYPIGSSKNLNVNHGVVEIDAALRLDNGSAYQGTKYSMKMLKGTVTASDTQKVVVYENSHVISSESLGMTWYANSAPAITLTASANRSIQIFARWTA
ncbi:hypothetical protein [Klebsiella pneumoniae]|uniref:hypothetical protein n=1 Tax=Klebsiella pneumoniae TaxID=573 RepID=UPI00177B7551|nr:hypothetical protein [Klebsiella pneumoniae]EKV3348888.1 hypothetical protein [Klebsiella pneumoniae]MBD8290062.1 hypothetical protein [Klebsiella pneumoniae]MEC6457367.1 hypothetical protein [Klebsiella pneumoniae]HCM6812550.1 hypothetical protein [Klebsiella pneumoniae]HCM7371920.1 hypothetical protein [Klebsiella pneumoniae]